MAKYARIVTVYEIKVPDETTKEDAFDKLMELAEEVYFNKSEYPNPEDVELSTIKYVPIHGEKVFSDIK